MYPPKLLNTHPTVSQTLPALHSFRPISVSPILKHQLIRNPRTKYLIPYCKNVAPCIYFRKQKPHVVCAASNSEGVDSSRSWEKWVPRDFVTGDKVFRWISGATSSPIAQYIPSPTTFLHSVDPRIKLAWLLALVIIPAKSNILIRFGLVLYLAILSIWVQPRRVWMDQLGRVTLLCAVLFISLCLGTDGAPSLVSTRAPPSSVTGLPSFPASLEGYRYVVMKFGPLQITRKGLSAASTAACLTFTIFQSASLCLSTTTAEQLAFALQWFILPLANIGIPVAEVILTLLLSLRFINLVFDEVRNVALGIVSRRIQWQQLTTMETIDIFITYLRRIFRNFLRHAEQICQAMIIRGFRGDCNSHKIFLSADSSSAMANIFSLLCLVGLTSAATLSNYLII